MHNIQSSLVYDEEQDKKAIKYYISNELITFTAVLGGWKWKLIFDGLLAIAYCSLQYKCYHAFAIIKAMQRKVWIARRGKH